MNKCIYAEKFDMGLKIAVALAGFLNTPEGQITMPNIETMKEKVQRDYKKDGHIIVSYKSDQLDITWGQGHLCELYQAKDYNDEYKNWRNMPLPFIPERYQIKIKEGIDYKTGKKTGKADEFCKRQLNIIKKCFDNSDEIIIATDDDREGDYLADLVMRYLGYNGHPYKRMLIDSTTQSGLLEAYSKLVDGSTRKGIVMAGNCRSISDWVVGANLTAAATLKMSKALDIPLISIGRLQTAVLNFIIEREKAINNFVSKPFYQIKGHFTLANGEDYDGITDRYEDKAVCQGKMRSLSNVGYISKCEKKKVKKEVPLLYNSTDIYRAANEAYGYSAAKTLEIMQGLYDDGYISYPRTDSRHLTDDMIDKVDLYLDNLSADPKYAKWIKPQTDRKHTKRHYDTTKVESHYALCITENIPTKLSDEQAKIYDLIAKSIIRTTYDDAILEKTSIETTVNDVVFKSSGMTIDYPGWMIVSDTNTKETILPSMNVNDNVSGVYDLKEGKTEPPKRYTEATLLTAMQTCSNDIDDQKLKEMLKEKNKGGIGRPSTQPNIIKTVIDRYCTLKGKTIYPTENAMALMEQFPVSDLKSPEMTAEWENKLDMVEHSQMSAGIFLNEINESLKKWVQEVSNTRLTKTIASDKQENEELACPKCGNTVVFTKTGYAMCKGYFDKKCDFGIYSVAGKTLPKAEIVNLIKTGHTKNEIKGFKSKAGKAFSAKLKLNNEYKIEFDFNNNNKTSFTKTGWTLGG